MEWDKSVWESSLDFGLRTLRLAVDTHAITSHFAIPLLIQTPGGLVVEVTDGTDEYNATNYRVSFFYDLAKAAVNRMAFALAHELEPHGATAVSLTPGWLRSEAMLEAYGVTEANWRDATKVLTALRDLREPGVRRSGGRGARPGSRRVALERPVAVERAAGARSTASPISTAASPTPGGTSPRCRTRASRPTRPATAEPLAAAAVNSPRACDLRPVSGDSPVSTRVAATSRSLTFRCCDARRNTSNAWSAVICSRSIRIPCACPTNLRVRSASMRFPVAPPSDARSSAESRARRASVANSCPWARSVAPKPRGAGNRG